MSSGDSNYVRAFCLHPAWQKDPVTCKIGFYVTKELRHRGTRLTIYIFVLVWIWVFAAIICFETDIFSVTQVTSDL